VGVCINQDVNLVSGEYYKEELAFQQQIDRISQTAMLTETPVIETENETLLKVTYAHFENVEDARLQLFRPSDPGMDKNFQVLKSQEDRQYFSTDGMTKGMYRARFLWTMNGQNFFVEQVIHL
jgi:hypothetical protein